MIRIDDDELTQFLLNDLPPDQAAKIQQWSEVDEEFASRVEVNRFLIEAVAGIPCSAPLDQSIQTRRFLNVGRMLVHHRVAATIALLIVLISTAGASAWYMYNAPIMRDDLASGWFDSTKWLSPPEEIREGGVRAEKGYMRLVNRGYLRTRQEFREPIDIRFEWKWHQLGLNPVYSDHLGVAIRTNGTPNMDSFGGEASDGLIIKFDAWDGSISIHDDENHLTAYFAKSTAGQLPMPADEWHRIRITDNGDEICVYITGPLIKPTNEDAPALRLRKRTEGGGHRIAIYNRELVAFPHESCVRNFAVYRFREE